MAEDNMYIIISALNKIQSDILASPKLDGLKDSLSLLDLSHNPLTIQKGQCLGGFKSLRDLVTFIKLNLSLVIK